MTIPYSLFSGAGNRFFLIDNRLENLPVSLMNELCKKEGIDGTIALENSSVCDYKMRIFNPDGSEAEMCGNGLRCFIMFLHKLGLIKEKYEIETRAGPYIAWIENNGVSVKMLPPSIQKWNLGKNLHFINTGVPHAVIFVEDLDNLDVEAEGKNWRYHPLFSPSGTNVNFVKLNPHSISIRTYERGVERETLACGTGAVASALASAKWHAFSSPIEVEVHSGEKLKISFTKDFNVIEMHGPVSFVKEGCFSLNSQTSILHPL